MPNLIDYNLLCPACMHKHATPQKICARCKTDRTTVANKMEQLPVGTILNEKYYIGSVIGQGGFGITYRAWDMSLDVKVAVKEYFPGNSVFRRDIGEAEVMARSSESEEFFRIGREKFFQEARSLARFSNLTGVIGVRDFFQANGTAYIVMDYAEGRTLKELMTGDHNQNIMEILEMFRSLIEDLGAMHEQNLIHRDIKPENIMISPENKAVLLDFGAARAYMGSQVISSYSMTLTHGYAPVEQYQNAEQGPWTDVYALCATLYELVTGKQPITSLERLMNKKPLTRPSEMGVNIPKSVEDAIIAGMAIHKEERTQSMKELYAGLYGAQEQKKEVREKHGAPVWLTAILAVAMLAFGGLWVMELLSAPETQVVIATTVQGSEVLPWKDGKLDFGGNAKLEAELRRACGVEKGALLPSDAAKATELNLDGIRLADTGFLAQFTGLTSLRLKGTGITDLSVLAGMTKLEKLDVSDNAITDLEPLKNMQKLTSLWAQNNRLTSVAPLAALTSLEVLDVSNNDLTDISPLKACVRMRRLWIHHNRIASLEAVSAMRELVMLSAGSNAITDVRPLLNCTNLSTVYLYDNQISDLSPLEQLKKQGLKDVYGNPGAK